jgi:hypothetical protein
MCFRKPAYRSSVDGRHCDLKKLTKTNFTLSLKPGIALTSASEYAAVHRLVGPYIQEGVEATVPPATRQVVEVVTERPGHDGASLAEELGLESRRCNAVPGPPLRPAISRT